MDNPKNHFKRNIILIMLALFLGIFLWINSIPVIEVNIDISEEIRQRITEKLVSDNKRLLLPEGLPFTLPRGESEIWVIGIRNDKDIPLNYRIKITSLDIDLITEKNLSWFVYSHDKTTLNAGEVDVRNIRIIIPPSYIKNGSDYLKPDNYVNDGIYHFKLEILDIDILPSNNIYAQKDFVIEIKSEIEDYSEE